MNDIEIYSEYLKIKCNIGIDFDILQQLEKIAIFERILNWQINFSEYIEMSNDKKKTVKVLQENDKYTQIKIGTIKNNDDFKNNFENDFSNFIDIGTKEQNRNKNIKRFFLENNIMNNGQNINRLCKSKWCEFNIHFDNECPWFGKKYYENDYKFEEKNTSNNE